MPVTTRVCHNLAFLVYKRFETKTRGGKFFHRSRQRSGELSKQIPENMWLPNYNM